MQTVLNVIIIHIIIRQIRQLRVCTDHTTKFSTHRHVVQTIFTAYALLCTAIFCTTFVQLQQMASNISDGAAGLSVCKGMSSIVSIPSPILRFQIMIEIFPRHHLIINTKAMVFSCRRSRWERLDLQVMYSWTPCGRTVYILNYKVLLHSYHHKVKLMLSHPQR